MSSYGHSYFELECMEDVGEMGFVANLIRWRHFEASLYFYFGISEKRTTSWWPPPPPPHFPELASLPVGKGSPSQLFSPSAPSPLALAGPEAPVWWPAHVEAPSPAQTSTKTTRKRRRAPGALGVPLPFLPGDSGAAWLALGRRGLQSRPDHLVWIWSTGAEREGGLLYLL